MLLVVATTPDILRTFTPSPLPACDVRVLGVGGAEGDGMVAGMAKVVELAVDMVAKSDAQLRADVAVAPDSTSEEQVIESTSATQFNAETTLLETWGKSSYTTGRSSIAASASVSGSGFGFSASVSAFGGSAADKQEARPGQERIRPPVG